MKELIFLVEEDKESGYTAMALGTSIFTEADTLEDLREMIKDAVHCHFDEPERPKIIRLHFVREEVFAA
jgi:predicted RNase H-like HicB family nuclease